MSTISIRRGQTADLVLAGTDVEALFAEDSAKRDATINQDWPRGHATAWLESHLDAEGKILLVAEAPDYTGYLVGEVVAASSMRQVRVAVLVSMYVRPAFRGRGIGRDLVAAFRDWAIERRADRMSVTAYTANADAIRFYERQGFITRQTQLEATVA
ncbi:hypothetical protein GCM10029992_57060 [Glycomyces albus]